MNSTQIVWKVYKKWMTVFIQFWVRIGIHCTQIVPKYMCSEWAWLYASGYPLKCIAPLFPISTRNLRVPSQQMSEDGNTKHIRWRGRRRRRGRDSFGALETAKPSSLYCSLPLRQLRSSIIADAASRETCLSNWLYSCIEDTIFVVSILHCWLVSMYCLTALIEYRVML